jgi:hypothetical protein
VVGAGGAAGAGFVVGVVGAGVVDPDPDPDPVAPPAGGTVTGLVGVGAGMGRGSGAGAPLGEPRGGMATGDERTGIEGSGNDPPPGSETRSALVTSAVDVTDGSTTAAEPAAPEAYELGRAVEAAVPHTELPAVAGAAGAGPATDGAGAGAGAGFGGEPTGAVFAGEAIRPDQSEAE